MKGSSGGEQRGGVKERDEEWMGVKGRSEGEERGGLKEREREEWRGGNEWREGEE